MIVWTNRDLIRRHIQRRLFWNLIRMILKSKIHISNIVTEQSIENWSRHIWLSQARPPNPQHPGLQQLNEIQKLQES